MIKTNKDTDIFFSLARVPGNSGATFYSEAFHEHDINAVYLPQKMESEGDLAAFIESIRVLNICGCSVSMPFKESVIHLLDSLDESAKLVGAVNTIKREQDELVGYNTDYFGALKALKHLSAEGQHVVLLGAGGVAKAVAMAARQLQCEITVVNRTISKAQKLSQLVDGKALSLESLPQLRGDVFINATSIGMQDQETSPLLESEVDNFQKIMDVVLYPCPTKLIRLAKDRNKAYASGAWLNVHQASQQFTIYTGQRVTDDFLARRLKELESW